jgi:hypothetical protein
MRFLTEGGKMEVRLESKTGTVLTGVDPAVTEIQKRLQSQPEEWLRTLQENPAAFKDVEKTVHHAFQQMADQLVAGLLAQATQGDDFTQTAKKKVVEAHPERKFRSGDVRALGVRLLGGLMIYVATLYCGPVNRSGKGRGREGSGVYPEWALLGIQEGKSPALLSEVARQTALLPSYEIARQELAEHGVDLDIKELYGIGQHAGQMALAYRFQELEWYRAGKLSAASGVGKRFAAMIDGGRTKVRKTTRRQKGQGQKKTQKRRFRTDWREVKQIIVFELDEQGRMKKGTQPILDGTFSGPDEIMEVLAMRLHQVGASAADVVVFRADGAPWIWDRLPWLIQRLGLRADQVSEGLDWCHAVHNMSLALEAIVAGAERKRIFKKMRKWLKGGSWHKVVDELIRLGLAANLPQDSATWTEILYLHRHGERGRLDYATFRRRGLPQGSGAIESGIRRVINLRLKGNGIYWEEANAEALLALRCLVISGRWNEVFAKMLQSLAGDRRLEWKWTSPDMPAQLKAGIKIEPPKPQPQASEASYATAA